MEEKTKATIGCILFLLLILIVGVGGYFYTFQNNKHKEVAGNENKISDENKKDKSKDYIYYTDETVVSQNLHIVYKKPNINLKVLQAEAIMTELENENNAYLSSIQKISETSNDTGEEIAFNTDDIYSATVRDYEDYIYKNYVSLIVTDYAYDCFHGIYDYIQIKSFIFDIVENKRISNLEILSDFNTNLSEVKEKIKEKLEMDQTVIEGVESIKIEETINNLDNNNSYGLYIDTSGNLIIKYIVKSNQKNYNEIMTIG